jgi:hypothetical protein
MSDNAFGTQFELTQRQYLAGVDFYTWARHFHVIKDLCRLAQGTVLEVGTGDGIVKRCVQPFVKTYTVMDVNFRLQPDVLGDVRIPVPSLVDRFDVVIATEVLEHIPFEDFSTCLGHLHTYLRPGGRLLLTVPHRKAHMLVVTPRQNLWKWRFPVGITSLSEAYHRFVRRKIWIDPHHCWEIGDGRVKREHITAALRAQDFTVEHFTELPYCDYWLLRKQHSSAP